jgi:hypothetical protein
LSNDGYVCFIEKEGIEMAVPLKLIDKLATHTRVEFVDDEREMGNGVLVTLKKGFVWRLHDGDNRVRGFDTPQQAASGLRDVEIYEGPYDPD